MNKLIPAFIMMAAAFLSCCQSSSQSDTADSKVMMVGTNAEFAPFAYVEDGKILGFEIDMAEEVCKRMGYTMKIVDFPFDALIPELTMGAVHFVAAGMTTTEERAKKAFFSTPYLEDDPLVMVFNKGAVDPKNLHDLENLSVAVNTGYTAEIYLSDFLEDELIRLPTPFDGFMALESKRVDVFVTAKNTIAPFIEKGRASSFATTPLEGTAENCAILISKSYPHLVTPINEAIEKMVADGTVEKLKAKWNLS